jgi:hypothetical protein
MECRVSLPSRTIVEHALEHFVPPIYATYGVQSVSKIRRRQAVR